MLFDNKGFTFLEIILVVLILAIAIVPMVRAFSPGTLSAKIEEETTVFTNQARGTLNRVMALDFDTLNSNPRPDNFGQAVNVYCFESPTDLDFFAHVIRPGFCPVNPGFQFKFRRVKPH